MALNWFSDTEDSKVLPKPLEAVRIQHLSQSLKKGGLATFQFIIYKIWYFVTNKGHLKTILSH